MTAFSLIHNIYIFISSPGKTNWCYDTIIRLQVLTQAACINRPVSSANTLQKKQQRGRARGAAQVHPLGCYGRWEGRKTAQNSGANML